MVSGQSEHIPSVVGLPKPAEALIDVLKQQRQSCFWCSLEPWTLLPSSSQLEQGFTECNIRSFNLMEEIKKKPDQVSWIGEPSLTPLAVIHGPTGTFAVTKDVIIIGRDTTDSDIDLTSQEANFHSSSYMVLSYTGHPNRWGVQINGNNGVIINKKLYQQNTVPQYLPFSCVFRFPPASENYFFQAVELPRCERASHMVGPSNEPYISSARNEDVSQLTKMDQYNLETCRTSSPTSSDEASILALSQKTESVEGNKDDSSKDTGKPPYSYAQLITQAIMSTPDKQITLSGIYNFIMHKYPWYQSSDKGWQNSIRHNLSLSRYFVRTARGQNEPGKGSFWKMEPVTAHQNMEAAYEKKKAKSLKGCKSMNSPVSDLEEFLSEGHFISSPSDTSKTLEEDCIEVVDGQENLSWVSNEESSFSRKMTSQNTSLLSSNQPQQQAMIMNKQSDMAALQANTNSKATKSTDVVKDLRNISELPRREQFHDLEGGHLAELERCCEWSTRTAQSAPCSPKGIFPRREQTNVGSTFRVRQSVKDGRSLLQICHSPPEFRSVTHNRYLKTVCSNSRNQVLYQLRGGTKSLSTTPVRELLQGTSGLRFEDLKRDFPNLTNQSTSKDRSSEHTVNKAYETTATTSFSSRLHSDHSAPTCAMAQEQRIISCGKPKMSIYGKFGEHAEKLKSLDEVCEEIKGTALNNFETNSGRVTRKYGMDGTIRPDIERLFTASKRFNSDAAMSSEDKIISSKVTLKRRHESNGLEENVKRCHFIEIGEKSSTPLEKELLSAPELQRSVEVAFNDNNLQMVHVSEAPTTSQLSAQFAREGLFAQPIQQSASSGTSTVPLSKEYHKHLSAKSECIAKPIPLGPSGPAVNQLLTGGKLDSGFSGNKVEADFVKRYEDCLLCASAAVCRETNVTSGIPFSHLPPSSCIEVQNSTLYRQLTPNAVQNSLHINNNSAVPLPAALTKTFSSGLQTPLQSGIRPAIPQMQRGILASSGVSNNNLHSTVYSPKFCFPISIQNEALSAKSVSASSFPGKLFEPVLPDLGYSLQNITRTQPTTGVSQQQSPLNVAQPQSNLTLPLSSVLNGIRIPSISVPLTANPASAISTSFSTINEHNVTGIANLIQGGKQQNEPVNVVRDQLPMSQEAFEAKFKFESFARFVAEQSTFQKFLQQQQQQHQEQQQEQQQQQQEQQQQEQQHQHQQETQLTTALPTTTQDQLANTAFSNALLSQCINMQLLQQLKSSTASTNLSTLILPNGNPLTLFTSQNSYIPVTSRPDLVANGIVNNGVCELLGMPTRNVNNLLGARNVTSL